MQYVAEPRFCYNSAILAINGNQALQEAQLADHQKIEKLQLSTDNYIFTSTNKTRFKVYTTVLTIMSGELSMSGETGSDSLIWSFIFKLINVGIKWRHIFWVVKVYDADTYQDVKMKGDNVWVTLSIKWNQHYSIKTSVAVDTIWIIIRLNLEEAKYEKNWIRCTAMET